MMLKIRKMIETVYRYNENDSKFSDERYNMELEAKLERSSSFLHSTQIQKFIKLSE